MAELVEVAWADDQVEAELIQGLLEEAGIRSVQEQVGLNGPTVGFGLLNPGGGARRIVVHERHVEAAQALLAEALAEGARNAPEPVNARHLEEIEGGRRPRGYGLIGAYARAYLWSFGAIAAAFGAFMLLRALGLT